MTLDAPRDYSQDISQYIENNRTLGIYGKIANAVLALLPLNDIKAGAIASTIVAYLEYQPLMQGLDTDDGYDSDVVITVYPERKLVIVSIVTTTGERLSIDVPFASLAGLGLSDAEITEYLAPHAEQTRRIMAEVLKGLGKQYH